MRSQQKMLDGGPIGFRTGGRDAPLARRTRRIMASSRAWMAAAGALALATGIMLLIADTQISVRAIAVLLGVSSIGQGVLRLIATAREPDVRATPWRSILMGIAVIAAGAVCILVPSAGERGLLIGTALWFTLAGVQEVFDREHRTRWSYLLLATGVATAVALLFNGAHALVALTHLLALAMLVRGAVLIARATTPQ